MAAACLHQSQDQRHPLGARIAFVRKLSPGSLKMHCKHAHLAVPLIRNDSFETLRYVYFTTTSYFLEELGPLKPNVLNNRTRERGPNRDQDPKLHPIISSCPAYHDPITCTQLSLHRVALLPPINLFQLKTNTARTTK